MLNTYTLKCHCFRHNYHKKINFVLRVLYSIIFSTCCLKLKRRHLGATVLAYVRIYGYFGVYIIHTNIIEHGSIIIGITRKRLYIVLKLLSTFFKLRKSYLNRDLPLGLRTRMVKCYVFSTLFYRMDAQTLRKTDVKKIQALKIWVFLLVSQNVLD